MVPRIQPNYWYISGSREMIRIRIRKIQQYMNGYNQYTNIAEKLWVFSESDILQKFAPATATLYILCCISKISKILTKLIWNRIAFYCDVDPHSELIPIVGNERVGFMRKRDSTNSVFKNIIKLVWNNSDVDQNLQWTAM